MYISSKWWSSTSTYTYIRRELGSFRAGMCILKFRNPFSRYCLSLLQEGRFGTSVACQMAVNVQWSINDVLLCIWLDA